MTARGILLATVLTLAVGGAHAQDEQAEHDPHAHHKMMEAAEKPAGAEVRVEIPDVRLVTQDGEKLSLESDLVSDHIVVMDFVYTTCTTVCPVLSAILAQVQHQLGDRVGKDIVLVSITVDPLRDTPARLKSYSQKMKAGEGWYWLTGSKLDVDDVLKSLGVFTPNFEDHPSVVLVGDSASGDWSRFVGFPGASQIVDRINELSAAREAQSAARE